MRRILGRAAPVACGVVFAPAAAIAAPAVTISSVSDPLLNASETSTTVTWSASEAGTFTLRLGGTGCGDGVQLSSGSYTSGDTASQLAASTFVEAPATNVVRICVFGSAPDPGPGEASTTITRDTIAPDTAIAGALTSGSSAQFTLTASESGSSFECSLDSGPFGACPSGYSGLADGAHSFRARAIDGAGNVDASPAEHSWTVDTTGPDTTITSSPPAFSASRSATFVFGSPVPGATFECGLDGSAWGACTSPLTIADLLDETHVFLVRARAPGGAVDPFPASRIWTVDTVVPDTTIVAAPPPVVAVAAASVSFASPEAGVAFECSLDGLAWSSCTSPHAIGGLANGQHALEVRAVDPAGNVDATPALAAWAVDVPVAFLDKAAPRAVQRLKARALDHGALLSWGLPADVDLDHVLVERRAEGAGAPISFEIGLASAFRDRGLRNGLAYRYTLVVVDEAGNRSAEVAVSVTPQAQLLRGPAAAVAPGGAADLAWVPVKRATYYNVQLFRGARKVLSIWPRRARAAIPARWQFEGRSYRLRSGTYTWFVWPGFGSRAESRYGDVIGRSTFRVARP